MQLLLNDFQDCILPREQETRAPLCGGRMEKNTVSVLYLTTVTTHSFLTHSREIEAQFPKNNSN